MTEHKIVDSHWASLTTTGDQKWAYVPPPPHLKHQDQSEKEVVIYYHDQSGNFWDFSDVYVSEMYERVA